MSELPLSPCARALLDAAKSDGPSATSRASMWGGVSAATGAAAAAGTAMSGSMVGATVTALSAKLLVIGALFGSGLTLGFALGALRVGPSVVLPRRASLGNAVETSASCSGARSWEDVLPIPLVMGVLGSSARGTPVAPQPAASAAKPAAAKVRATGTPAREAPLDPLMREAALVAEARAALVRSDAVAALSALDAARRVGSRDLEPEEFSLRARALRVLGHEREAADVEGILRSRYPDHFLSR